LDASPLAASERNRQQIGRIRIPFPRRSIVTWR
jgi:hypothetical protein